MWVLQPEGQPERISANVSAAWESKGGDINQKSFHERGPVRRIHNKHLCMGNFSEIIPLIRQT